MKLLKKYIVITLVLSLICSTLIGCEGVLGHQEKQISDIIADNDESIQNDTSYNYETYEENLLDEQNENSTSNEQNGVIYFSSINKDNYPDDIIYQVYDCYINENTFSCVQIKDNDGNYHDIPFIKDDIKISYSELLDKVKDILSFCNIRSIIGTDFVIQENVSIEDFEELIKNYDYTNNYGYIDIQFLPNIKNEFGDFKYDESSEECITLRLNVSSDSDTGMYYIDYYNMSFNTADIIDDDMIVVCGKNKYVFDKINAWGDLEFGTITDGENYLCNTSCFGN